MSEEMREAFEKFMDADGAGYAGVYPVWKAAWAACREEAARVCEQISADNSIVYNTMFADQCAESIRGL